MTSASNARTRVRLALAQEIADAARVRLQAEGPVGLSMRSVAADVGMAPSALYRYFPSKDALLTTLIVDAYTALAVAIEDAMKSASPGKSQWVAGCRSIRVWAQQRPHEFALLYGSPVPGYRAPADTVEPSSKIHLLLAGAIEAARAVGKLDEPADPAPPKMLAKDLRAMALGFQAPELSPAVMMRAVTSWVQVTGLISLELFGHLKGGFTDNDLFFEHSLRLLALNIGMGNG